MDPLSVTASVIAVIQLTGSVISAVYNYRKGVKNAPEDAAKIIQDLTGLSHILEKLLQMIESEQSNKEARLASLEGLVKPDGPLQLCRETLESLNAKLQPDNGWRAVKQSLMWPLKKDYINNTLDQIATAKETIGLALTVDLISLALETKDSIDALAYSFESYQIDEERKKILSGLSPTDPTINHREAYSKHQKGTSDWFIRSDQYSKWRISTAESVLWVNGIPGCGKTILCSIAVEDLLQNYKPKRPRTAIAYYYFNFQTKAEQQFINLLRSITFQLSCQCPTLPGSVRRLQYCFNQEFSEEYMIDVVKEVVESFPEVYLVIDAFDECEQSEKLLRWIQGLAKSQDNGLHLLISSRQDYHFRNALDLSTTSILALDEYTFQIDIQLYIREQLSTDPRMMKWPPSVQNDIEQSLLANSGGLFRLVDCQLDILRKCLRINNIKRVLETLPKTLNEIYDKIITSIDEAYVEDACMILKWLVFAARPLRVNELNEVLAFDRSDPHNPTFSPHLRLPLLEDVLTLCSSLVTVKAAGQDAPKVESLEVRLAHNSVKDYLLSHDIKSGASSQFALEAGLAHSLIAGCCLGYLQQFHSQLDMAMLQQFPLASYAAQFWTEHYRHAVASDRDLLDRLALQLLTTKEVYRNCCCLYNPDRRWQGIALKKDPGVPPLYYASLMGLSRIIILLIANGADPNEDASRCQQKGALGAAAYNGHESIVQDLLNAGANPDGGSEYDEYGSPIGAAASQGHTAIVSLLLRAGANLNKSGVDGAGSALYQAVSYRRPGIVKILVDAGADANANAGMSGVSYAISEAAQQGDVESVCLLFPKVSDWLAAKTLDEIACSGDRELLKILLQTKRGRGMTGIQYAARAGMSDLVQSMVGENWGDANNYPSTTTTTALCQAAASGSLETTQILYENGADKIVSDEELSEAVALAANDGHTLVVKYLLDRGADTGSQKCQDALVDAARNGHLSTVQILLTAGVSANSQYKHEYTIGWLEEKSCLWAAVDQQHLEISRLLLASGADPNTQYNTRYDNISALNRSIKTANKELFDLLIDKGASPTPTQTKHARYDTLALPVHYAASVGNVHILRRLLEAGLKPDEVLIEDGWTALFHAAKAGHEEVLRILIHDYGADIHRCANKGTVAIHTAAYHNHSKCIEVFLDAGLDVDVQGRFGRTSLHWAAQQGSIDAVRILLDRGASVFIEEETKSMKAVDIAKVKALGVLESQKSEYHWKQPREDNYEPILKMLEEKAAQPRHGSNEHGHPFRGRLRSVTGRGDSRQISPP